MSEQNIPTNINEVKDLSPEVRNQLSKIPFPKGQFKYLASVGWVGEERA